MVNYDLLEDLLNIELIKIILLIKEDYYNQMSDQKRQVIERLLNTRNGVVVNQGISKFNDNTLAHGGRTLRDEKIHFYPDVRNFNLTEEALETCKKILPHEIFHFFIQPDELEFDSDIEKEMASFYTEGLVEKEARKFCASHPDISFEKANYGYNINFVNLIQDKLGASQDEVIFSENTYLKNIGKYISAYEGVLIKRNVALGTTEKFSKAFPVNLQKKVTNRIKTMILQNGNIESVEEKLKSIGFYQKGGERE